MKDKLIELLEVRKIMALIIIILFVVMAVMGRLESNFVQTVIISIIAFYFGKATALDVQQAPTTTEDKTEAQ